jgi:hypothetical protein
LPGCRLDAAGVEALPSAFPGAGAPGELHAANRRSVMTCVPTNAGNFDSHYRVGMLAPPVRFGIERDQPFSMTPAER